MLYTDDNTLSEGNHMMSLVVVIASTAWVKPVVGALLIIGVIAILNFLMPGPARKKHQ